MAAIYLVMMVLFLITGIRHIFDEPFTSLHFFLFTLYIHISFYDLRGQPFPRVLYLGVALALAADGYVQLFYIKTPDMLAGVVSFFLAFSALQAARRQQPKK